MIPSRPIDMHQSPGPRSLRKRVAIGVSLAFHVLVIAGLAFWYVQWKSEKQQPSIATAAGSNNETGATPQFVPAESSPDVTSHQVNNTLECVQDVYEEKSVDEQLSVLEEKASELEKLASAESIDEIATKFHAWSNTTQRASVPSAEAVAGEFDFATAELHEVKRLTPDSGETRYLTTLVDAQGRAMDVEMTAEEGETAYRTLQTLKKFPLAQSVYRQIAMPLLDKATAATGPSNSDRAGAAGSEVDDRDPFDGELDTPAIDAEKPSPEEG